MINSTLVSAQNRKRCYWTNIPGIEQPEDMGIILMDVLESDTTESDLSNKVLDNFKISPKGDNIIGTTKPQSRTIGQRDLVYHTTKKMGTLMSTDYKQPKQIFVPICGAMRGRYHVDGVRQDHKMKIAGLTEQQLEIRKDDKTNTLTTVQKDNVVVEPTRPYRIGAIGKGGQGYRIYSVIAKSVCLSTNGGGRGAKTGLYKIDLPDGDYIIRKLTPLECERLQTLPDNYTLVLDENGKQLVSNTQRYKGIGNGWTTKVIAHILGGLKNVLINRHRDILE